MKVFILLGILVSNQGFGIKIDKYVEAFTTAEQCLEHRDEAITIAKSKEYKSFNFKCETVPLRDGVK